MIRPSRPVQIGVAVSGIAGALVLAGCSTSSAEAEGPTSAATLAATPEASADSGSASSASTYTDGTYTAEGSYATPESVETITVTVTLQDDVITAVQVVGSPQKRESQEYQSKFIGGISDEVVGQDIDALSVSRVAGSSLTSGGFDQAIESIKSEAAA